jgi:hypothetical protein
MTGPGARVPPATVRLEREGATAPDCPDERLPYLEREGTGTFGAGRAMLLDGIEAAVARQAAAPSARPRRRRPARVDG